MRSDQPILTITPSSGWTSLRLGDLWASRELVFFLVWRDVKVRYKQTALGAAWAVLQPLMTMAIFAVVFGKLVKVPSDGVPYTLFAFTALVPWTFFSNAVTHSSNSLVANSNLLKKVYFPRLILPIASVGGLLLDLAIGLAVLLGLLLWYGAAPSWRVFAVPVALLQAVVAALGIGFWLSAVNIRFRDVRYLMPFLIQVWLFATPVAYPSSLIKNETARALYGLNPMTGVVETMRWALLGTGTGPSEMAAVSALITLLILVTGAFYFRRVEKFFADVA